MVKRSAGKAPRPMVTGDRNDTGTAATGADRSRDVIDAVSALIASLRAMLVASRTEDGSPESARIHSEAIATVYRNAPFGVLAAAVASVILALSMLRLNDTTAERGGLFAAYISLCAILHTGLAQLFKRRPERTSAWLGWSVLFTVLALCEGIGWGWAPVGLVPGGDFEASLLCLLVTVGVAAGSVPAFSPYLPAFAAFVLPATIPYFVKTLGSANPLEQAANTLELLFIAGIGGFGLMMNRVFRNQVALRMRAEELAGELQTQVAKVEAANRAKSTFLAAASHDLRQPVHALSLFTGALRGMSMSKEASEILHHIDQSTQALDSLFAAILDISKLDAGVVPVNREAFFVAPMLHRLGRESEDYAAEKGLRLNVRSAAVAVHCDPVLLERVVRNIIVNAVRYTVRGRILVACRRRGAVVRMEVWDTGPGIPARETEAIFQEYYQLDNPERDRTKGLGLGLAIVRRLVTLLGCELQVRSRLGRGSVFAVSVPAAQSAPSSDDEAMQADRPIGGLRDRLIVVIDDETEILSGMSTILRHWGFRVVVAVSSHDAIAELADQAMAPDLIIADFRLRASESGIDAIELLRAEYNTSIAAMLISGDTAPERLIEAHRSGLLLLHKPVANGRLRAAINNLLLSAGQTRAPAGG